MKVGRNNKCPCGSEKKYKQCCLNAPKFDYGPLLVLKGKKAEEFTQELAKNSFFVDWCYPNPKIQDDKELCDLLVVYDNIAIIWQVKDIEPNEEGKYKQSEVEKNLKQLAGAKRQLFELKTKIQLENPRRGKEIFDPTRITEIYLISALLGPEEDMFSLVDIIKAHAVHRFTREFMEITLNELDTIKDFTQYLREKEKLISSNKQITLLGGEKDLLSYYLMNERSFEKLDQADCLMITDGMWDAFQKKPEYLKKKEEDKVSYGWDSIINRVHTCGEGYEKVARKLASSNRFQRRCLGKAFYEAQQKSHYLPPNQNTFRRIVDVGGITYCFTFVQESMPRDIRKALLNKICFIARGMKKHNKMVIGIATEKNIHPLRSYDFCILEIPKWNNEEQTEMERLQKETNIFVKPIFTEVREEEYPIEKLTDQNTI